MKHNKYSGLKISGCKKESHWWMMESNNFMSICGLIDGWSGALIFVDFKNSETHSSLKHSA